MPSTCEALATGAAWDDACDCAGDHGGDRGYRGGHVTFRSDRGIRGVDNRREGEVLRREWGRLVLRGESLPVRRSGIRMRRCTAWRDGESHATLAPRSGRARVPVSGPGSRARSAIAAW